MVNFIKRNVKTQELTKCSRFILFLHRSTVYIYIYIYLCRTSNVTQNSTIHFEFRKKIQMMNNQGNVFMNKVTQSKVNIAIDYLLDSTLELFKC